MKNSFRIRQDGYDVTFEVTKEQTLFLQYLLDKQQEWRETATTYKKAIDIISALHKSTNKSLKS